MSALISQEDLNQFENMIYLPMVISVFNIDRKNVDEGGFKLKGPYQELIDQAKKCAEKDLIEARAYLRQHNLKIEQGSRTDSATEYIFYHNGYQDMRRYLNLRLRNRTEELIRVYLQLGSLQEKPSAN